MSALVRSDSERFTWFGRLGVDVVGQHARFGPDPLTVLALEAGAIESVAAPEVAEPTPPSTAHPTKCREHGVSHGRKRPLTTQRLFRRTSLSALITSRPDDGQQRDRAVWRAARLPGGAEVGHHGFLLELS